MKPIHKIDSWLAGQVAKPHKVRASWLYIVLVIVVSLAWQGPDQLQRVVHDCCAFRGEELLSLGAFRLVGGAFLVDHLDELAGGLVGLLIALPMLERRMGALALVAVTATSHIGATLVVDAIAYAIGLTTTLSQIDAGSSVVMFSAIAAIAVASQSRKPWFILAAMILIDAMAEHDQATAEHVVGSIIGASIAFVILNRRQMRETAQR